MPAHSPVWIDGHGLMFDPEPSSRAEAIAEARAVMLAAGLDEWDVDEALARPHVRVERVWWSDTAGFAYAEHPDARRVVMVLGLAKPEAAS